MLRESFNEWLRRSLAPLRRARSLHGLVAELALVEINRARGASGGVRIVGDHDDRLAMFTVKRLEQGQNLVPGFAVQVAGGLVAEQQSGVGHDGAGNAHALLFPAGKLAGIMLLAACEADNRQRRGHVPLPLGAGAILVALGGLAYTGGIVFYRWRELPYNHALWHAAVLLGSGFHFFAILFYVMPRGVG